MRTLAKLTDEEMAKVREIAEKYANSHSKSKK